MEDSKVNIHPCWTFNSFFILFNVLRQIISLRPDRVFFNIHFLSFGDKKIAAALGLLMPMLCKWLGFPSIVLLHNITETVDLKSAGITNNAFLQKIYGAIGTLLTKIILQASFVTLTISKYVEILEEKYGAKNIALVPHGSFETPPLPSYQEKEEVNIMTFGKFGTYKKVENLIEAVDVVRRKLSQKIKLVIAGTDSPNMKGYLKAVAKKYSHIQNVEFTGYVEEEDVPKVFTESDMVVFPYTSTTGSSGVLHQAGSYGRAAILPNIGDLKSLSEEEGYTGEFFDPAKKEDLASSIEKLVLNKAYRKSLGEQNYVAAASLPMNDICDWYLLHFYRLNETQAGFMRAA